MIQPSRTQLTTPLHRRIAHQLARAATLLSAAMLMLSLAAGDDDDAEAAGIDSGSVTIGTTDSTPQPLNSGGSATVFSMLPPSGAACPGSGAETPPYRWQTFMVSDSVDVSNLTYAVGPNAITGAFVSPMYDSVGDPIINRNPSATPLGLISGIPTMSYSALVPPAAPPAGDYKVGFACTLAGATVSFWTGRITVTADSNDVPGGFTWALAAPPRPPITGLATSQIDGPGVHLSWTAPTGDAPSDYTIAISPAVAGAAVTAPASATTLDITGLVADTAYTITVTANYPTAPLLGPPANVAFTWSLAAPPPITGLIASQIAGPGVRVSWTAPTGMAPANYSVGFSPTVAGAPFTVPAGSTTLDVTSLVANTAYTITVTANYATAPLTGPPAIVEFTFVPATTTTVAGTTTTVAGTTTSVDGTTTTAPASGTTTTRPTSPATPIQVASPSPSTAGTLAETGFSPYPYVIWGILLLVLGRIAILLRRPHKVRAHSK